MRRCFACFFQICIALGAWAQGAPTVVVVPGAIQLTISYTSQTCSNLNGTITVSATGGTPPYRFADDGVSFQSNGHFTGLWNGFYRVVVKDASGLQNGAPINIPQVGVGTLVDAPAYINPTGCATLDGSITLEGYNFAGGNPPYQFSLDGVNYQSNTTFSNLGAGNYTFFVRNAQGCTDSAYFRLVSNCPISGTWDYTSSVCRNEGYITVTSVSGGSAPYAYSLDGGSYGGTLSFTGLTAGIHYLRIRDAAGNILLTSIQILQGCPLSATAAAVNASCNNNDGTITVSPTGGTGTYTYSIDGTHYQAGNVFGGLSPGIYTITVRDNGGQETQAGANIINGCSTRVGATTINTNCQGNNGTITATVINGTAPYEYSIDGVNFQSSGQFTFVPIGTYTVTAIDASNVPMTTTVNVGANPFLVPAAYPMAAGCTYNDGTLIVNPRGAGTFEYSLNTIDWQSSNVFTGLYTNGYTVYMKDARGCVTGSGVYWIGINCIKVTAVTANSQCGGSTGTITATGTNGAQPYSYSIDGVNFQPGNVFNNVAPADYTITIRGANGAMGSTAVTVKANCLQVVATPANAKCGKSDGSISVVASNGATPYQYSLDGVNFVGSGQFDGLPAGPYTLTVKDATGAVGQTTANIGNIAGPVASAMGTAASCKNNDGVITVSVISGTAPFGYSAFQNGVSFSNLSALPTGDYQVVVTDANGCVGMATATVALTNDLTVSVGGVAPVCEGVKMPLSAVSAAGTYSWSPATGLNSSTVANPILTPSTTQQYTVTASQGPCTASGSVLVTVLPAPVPTVVPAVPVCYGKSVTLSGGGGGSYSWSPATYLNNTGIADPTVVHPQASITYFLSVTGDNGCTCLKPASVVVSVSPPGILFAGNDTTVAIGQPLQMQAVDVNGTGFSSYSWSPPDGLNDASVSDPVAVLHEDETYTVAAYSDAGCAGTGTIRVKVYAGPDIYVPNAFSPNSDGHNDVLKAIPAGIRQFRYFTIFDRWGQLVFSTGNSSIGWDGSVDGKMHAPGVFVWQAEGVDYRGNVVRRKGTVVLVR